MKLIDTLNFQKEMGGNFSVVDEGTTAQPASDRRPVFAALGFLGGGALPVGLLLLVGLANPRYRFSDETGTDLSGLTLLGILPDLPDRLSDPEQASIAAHCVHQIRTMLQISGAPEERRVFAITSAAPGDGKTSLTLALGLSYAACGTRTLLIDCDLVGAGLTARMNVNSAEGVLEAITNRSLLEYVRSTDVADVSILPVGSAQTLHASTLSPAALRRLIDEAKKQFDTILVDTGPILGSIEASLVCAAADAVVLTVARGQQRPLVEKAISHLRNIGARLAGVVFNRAQTADFDRSISGVSLRSVSSGSGHNGMDGPRFGTLGRAVHSHGKSSDLNEG
jgi:capsular exopolysaccharide synthesis family protein